MVLSDIRGRIFSRLEWNVNDATGISLANSAVNEGQRLFAFLTLSLEATRPLILTAGVSFYQMFALKWDDWIVPLRLVLSPDTSAGQTQEFDSLEAGTGMFNDQTFSQPTSTTPKIRPASLYEMAAASDTFLTDTGTPSQYGCLGWDLMFFNKQPTVNTKVNVTYARSSVQLVNDTDSPEIHGADVRSLIDYGEWRLRANEGGQELIEAGKHLAQYFDCAKERADQVRARALSLRYDHQPFELQDWDYSKLLKTRTDLSPYRTQNRWTGQS